MEFLSFDPKLVNLPKLVVDPTDSNYYRDEQGVRFDRVTHVLASQPKPWLEKWRVKVGADEAERFATETADYGHDIHKVTELNDIGRHDDRRLLIRDKGWLLIYDVSWRVWCKLVGVRWLMVEQTLSHSRLQIAGTIDRLGILKGDLCTTLVDLKSTKALSDSMGLQLFLYRMLIADLVERLGLDQRLIPARAIIAHLPGPRYDSDGNNVTEFDRVRVKEFFFDKYKDAAFECLREYWQLRR